MTTRKPMSTARLLAGASKFDPRRHQVLPKSMLRHFRDYLNFVTELVCIGYGFGNLHINTVIREWLELCQIGTWRSSRLLTGR